MKFQCWLTPGVGNIPSWITLEKQEGQDWFLASIDWNNEELREVLGGDFDPPVGTTELLEQLGFGAVVWLSSPLHINKGCYLEGLNEIFPHTIPVKSPLPIFVNEKPCLIIDLSLLTKRQKHEILKVYQGDKVPIVLWALFSNRNLAVIPCDLVE